MPDFSALYQEHCNQQSVFRRGRGQMAVSSSGFDNDEEMQDMEDMDLPRLLSDVYDRCVEPVFLILRRAWQAREEKRISRSPTSGEVLNALNDDDMAAARRAAKRLHECIRSLSGEDLVKLRADINIGWAIWIWMPKWDQLPQNVNHNDWENAARVLPDAETHPPGFCWQEGTWRALLRPIPRLSAVREPLMETAFKLQTAESPNGQSISLAKQFQSLLERSFGEAGRIGHSRLFLLNTFGFFDGDASFRALRKFISPPREISPFLKDSLALQVQEHRRMAKSRRDKATDAFPLCIPSVSKSRRLSVSSSQQQQVALETPTAHLISSAWITFSN